MRLRSLGAVLLTIICAAALGVTSMLTSAFALEKVMAEVALLADEGWIMSGTGQETPDAFDVSQAESLYLDPGPAQAPFLPLPGQLTFPTYAFQPLTTPEQFCPIVCHPDEPPQTFSDSLAQGASILDGKIVPQLEAGDNVAVFGYSQSASIATLEMNNLLNNPPAGLDPSDLSHLHVVLVGDINNGIGGILDRFQFPDGINAFSLTPAPQHLPFLNVPLSMAPTPTSPFPTDIYTAEYDGWANFPQDPTNILADINAILGIQNIHIEYLDLTPPQVGDAINVGTVGDTTYYMIPTEQLPILSPIYQMGDFGKEAGDAIAPWLQTIIDWAYGNPGDPAVGVAGPWAVDASGQLADDNGVAGLLLRMDPLQMLAGLQYAAAQSIVRPIDDILGFAGQQPLPASFVDTLQALFGYDFINEVDTFLRQGLTDLATALNIPALAPDAIFDGTPLISGQPLIDLVGGIFDIFNFFGN